MASFFKFFLTLALLVLVMRSTNAQLSPYFYSNTCKNLLPTVKSAVQSAISKEARVGASLLRLYFHDCFVNGCDGSVLLDDISSFTGEKNANANRNSARGFDVIDNIKSAVEKACPRVVSCADILAIAARDSVVTLGGPSWEVKLGRRDAITASPSAANNPRADFSDDNNLALLDPLNPASFDNNYFENLVNGKGKHHWDQELLNGGSTDSQGRTYSSNPRTFHSDFAAAMIKIGDIGPLTGSNGEIRKNCRRIN